MNSIPQFFFGGAPGVPCDGFFLSRRKVDFECRTLADLRIHVNPPALLPYNAIDGGKPKPRPLALGLCGKERIENLLQDILGNAAARVRDRKTSKGARLCVGVISHIRFRERSSRGADGQPSPVRHGVAGVDREVQQNLFKLSGIRPDARHLLTEPELDSHILCFCGALYGMTRRQRKIRAQELLERFDLVKAGGRRFGGYSKGMKRKLTIAAGIIHSPEILFLDEPTTGIDVASARQIRQLISDLNASGTTIFLTTHYIEEAQRLCGRIAFIVQGRIVRIDTVEELMRRTDGRHVMQFSVSPGSADLCDTIVAGFPGLRCQAVADDKIRVESPEPVRVGPLVRLLEDHGVEVSEARKIQPSLEDVFVEITGVGGERME